MKLTKIQIETLRMAKWELEIISGQCTAGKAGVFNLNTCRALVRKGLMECTSGNMETNRWVDFRITPQGEAIPEIVTYWRDYTDRHTGKRKDK